MSTLLSWDGPLFNWLLRSSWQAGVLVLLVLAAQRLFGRNLSPTWRHALWLVVIVRLCLPVAPSSMFSIFNLAQHRTSVIARSTTARVATVSVPDADILTEPMTEHRLRGIAETSEVPGPVDTTRTHAPMSDNMERERLRAESGGRSRNFRNWLPLVWAAVLVVLAARVGWQNVRFLSGLNDGRLVQDTAVIGLLDACRKQLGVSTRVEIIETALASSPSLYGVLRHRLLLPPGMLGSLTQDELRYVLQHEMAHLKRLDPAVNALATVLQLIHWFNPLIWLGVRRMRADCELACDALVLARSREGEARLYGKTIVKLLEGFVRPASGPGLVGILEDMKDLKRRLQWIVDFRRHSSWPVLAVVLLLVLCVVGLTDALPQAKGNVARQLLPIDLTPYYDSELSDFDKPGVWEAVPHGLQNWGGVPFEAKGLLQLYGTGSAGSGSVFRDRVVIDVAGRRFGQLHVLHGTAYSAPAGTPVARLVFRYSDGTSREQPVLYAHHVRNWWRAKVEFPVRVADPNTKVIWRGTHRQAEVYGKTLRLYKTAFPNPEPAKAVAKLELVSTKAEPAWVILAMTTDSAAPGSVEDNTPDLELDNPPLAGELLLHVVGDPDGQPIPGATVAVNFGDYNSAVADVAYRTDATGTCSIGLTDPAPSLIHTRASAKGYAPIYMAWLREKQDDPTYPGIPKEYTLQLPRAVSIGGMVLDETGKPIPNARVRITGGTPSRGLDAPRMPITDYVFTTDTDGRWRCDFMVPFTGNLQVVVLHKEHVTIPSSRFRRDCDLPKEELLNHSAVITMCRGGRVCGVVRATNGKPIAGASVFLGNGQGLTAADLWATTDGHGYYEFGQAQLGDLEVYVQAAGYALAAKQVRATVDMPPVDFELSAGNGLRGRVMSGSGSPLAGVTVTPVGWRKNAYVIKWRGKTDADGRFCWVDAPDDPVTFDFAKAGYLRIYWQELKPSPEEQTIIMHPTPKVTGTVHDAATGKPIPKFVITAAKGLATGIDADGKPVLDVIWGTKYSRHAGVFHDGAFAMDLSTEIHGGESRLPSFVLKAEAEGYAPAMSRWISTEEQSAEWNADLTPCPNWSGVVRLPDGTACPNARFYDFPNSIAVTLRNGEVSGPAAEDFKAGADGHFSIPPQLTNRTFVVLAEGGFALVHGSQFGPDRDITVQPWGSIEGCVRRGKTPTAGLPLALDNAGYPPGSRMSIYLQYTAVTDSEGRFRFDRVPPGPLVVAKKIEGREGSCNLRPLVRVEVAPGSVTRVNIGGTGRPVVGRYRLPESARGLKLGAIRYVFAFREWPPTPTPLDLKTIEEHRAWYMKWSQTEEGKAILMMREEEPHEGILSDNGTFRVEDVPAGQFLLAVMAAFEADGKQVGLVGNLRFTVPETTAELSDQPLDVGELSLELARPLVVGQPAPDFDLPGLDGKRLNLATFRGKYLLVHVWGAPGYPPTRDELGALKEQVKDFVSDQRLSLLGMYRNCSLEDAKAVTRVLGLDWPQVPAGHVHETWPASEYHQANMVLIGPDSVVKAVELKVENLREELAKVLKTAANASTSTRDQYTAGAK